ncbi:unnamed protein product [Thelazia callipaeda]|uniref:WD_REPEATS_REGION domain-containing protein n=1 Tax=Thelazia callipaeda TaxID=103827 RepID=A0A0N5DAY4_THECL|nr:unnamed protein product [Thelazia callipaeda]
MILLIANNGEYVEDISLPSVEKLVINSVTTYSCPKNGLVIFAGRKDGSIATYTTGEIKPLRVLHEHRMNVCTLSTDPEVGKLLSGSWDNTAIVWPIKEIINDLSFEALCLEGHKLSVWAVVSIPGRPGFYLTGSADRTIKYWEGDIVINSFSGHEDVVRSLVVLSKHLFLSAANDSTIRVWDINAGVCLQKYFSTANEYIYSLTSANMSGRNLVANVGESGFLEIWDVSENGSLHHKQLIKTPAQSLWSVAFLKNSDIAVGASDGNIYIFTTVLERRANARAMQLFQNVVSREVAKSEAVMAAQQNETVKIRVAVGNGEPNIELRYNKGSDPYDAARIFLMENNLPLSYMDEVVQYIIENIVEARQAHSRSMPPQSKPSEKCHLHGKVCAQPRFHVPEKFSGSNKLELDSKRPRSELVPLSSFFQFGIEQTSVKAISKLRELNELQDHHKLNEEQLNALEDILKSSSYELKDIHVFAIDTALEWNIDAIVPVMDVFRLALLNITLNEIYCSLETKNEGMARGLQTLQRLTNFLVSANSDPVRILTCRAIANAALHQWGRTMLIHDMTTVIRCVAVQLISAKHALQLAAASALANWALIFLEETECGKVAELGPREDALQAIIQAIENIASFGDFNQTALIRLLQAIVTLMWGDIAVIQFAKGRNIIGIVNRVKDAVVDESGKSIARDIAQMAYSL